MKRLIGLMGGWRQLGLGLLEVVSLVLFLAAAYFCMAAAG